MSAESSSSSEDNHVAITMTANGVWTRTEPSAETCRQQLSEGRVNRLSLRIEPRLASTPADALDPFLPASRWFTLERWETEPDGVCRAVYRRTDSSGTA